MEARFLGESLAVRKSDIGKIKTETEEKYPLENSDGYVPASVDFDIFFDMKRNSFGKVDAKYRKVISVYGDNWFALGRMAFDEEGYFQKIECFRFTDEKGKDIFGSEDFTGGVWEAFASSVFDGGYVSSYGKLNDVPLMYRNMEALFRRLSRCNSGTQAFETLDKVTTAAKHGKGSIWKFIK